MTSINYRAYLKSPQWKATRTKALAAAGHRCSKCNSEKRLHVHHLTYVRLGAELMEDLQVLCEYCHVDAHGGDGEAVRTRHMRAKVRGAGKNPIFKQLKIKTKTGQLISIARLQLYNLMIPSDKASLKRMGFGKFIRGKRLDMEALIELAKAKGSLQKP